jgi:hypothetical protein
MTGPRFAIYFVPDAQSALYQLGASVLGYDCYTGEQGLFPADIPLPVSEWRGITAAPRRYGFHATLKAPFFLAEGAKPSDLEAALLACASSIPAPPEFQPEVKLLEDFAAIVPGHAVPALDLAASQCVKDFDAFRAPLTAQDRERRLRSRLSLRQIENLDRWGYPYVFDDFRFHMTLTGDIGVSSRAVMVDYLKTLFESRHSTGLVRIDRLALVRQDDPQARFRIVAQAMIGKS